MCWQTTKAQKLFERTRSGPPRVTIGVKEAIAISNRVSICDDMLARLKARENAHLSLNYPMWQPAKRPTQLNYQNMMEIVRPVVPTEHFTDRKHVIAYRAWRAGWIRTINKHKPTRNERRAARKALATKEH